MLIGILGEYISLVMYDFQVFHGIQHSKNMCICMENFPKEKCSRPAANFLFSFYKMSSLKSLFSRTLRREQLHV